MSLEAPPVLGHLSAWLTCTELCSLRTLSRGFYAAIPRHTWELTVSGVRDAAEMGRIAEVFPHVWCLRLQNAMLDEMSSMESLVPWLDNNWKLRELDFSRVTCVGGFYVHLLAEELQKLCIRQCYQVQQPAIIAPNLKTLVVEQCPITGLHADTRLPQLEELVVSSRSLTALQARHLIKSTLAGSPALQELDLAGCAQLEQVLVDPGDVTMLRRLNLSDCPKLRRVHVSSKRLESLDVSCASKLEFLLLDVERVVDLDLSFLKNLTHLYIRSSSLRRLNLRGCDQLLRQATSVECPNLQLVVLQGTSLEVGDFNTGEARDEVFALPDSDSEH
jgi:Leucine-rich repeat (LRR) protein